MTRKIQNVRMPNSVPPNFVFNIEVDVYLNERIVPIWRDDVCKPTALERGARAFVRLRVVKQNVEEFDITEEVCLDTLSEFLGRPIPTTIDYDGLSLESDNRQTTTVIVEVGDPVTGEVQDTDTRSLVVDPDLEAPQGGDDDDDNGGGLTQFVFDHPAESVVLGVGGIVALRSVLGDD